MALPGDGALELMLGEKLPLAGPRYFATEKSRQQWQGTLGDKVPVALG